MPRRRRYRANTHPTASTNMPWAAVLQYGPLAAEAMKYGYDYWRGRGNNEQGNESSAEGNTREEEMRQREEEMRQREETMRQREEAMRQREEAMRQREEEFKRREEEMKQREEIIKQKEEEMKQREEMMKQKENEMKQREEMMKQKEDEMKQREDELKQREDELKQREKKIKRMEDEMKEKMRRKNTKMRGEMNNDLEREKKRMTMEAAAEKSEQPEQEALIRKEEERERESQAHREDLEKAQKEAQEKAKDEEEIREKMRKELREIKALKEELKRRTEQAAAGEDLVSPPPPAAAEPSTVPPVGSGQQEHVPPLSPVRPPTLCRQYWTRTGCKKPACDQLHICKLLLAGICKFGARCRNEHSLASDHNMTVCTAGGLFREPHIIELQERFVEEGLCDHRFYLSQLEICRKQDGTCRNCIRIHICQRYVEGTCTEQQGCRFGHAVKTEHNIRVLHLHKAGDMNDLAILQLLSANTALRGARAAPERAFATGRGASAAPRH